MANSKGPGSNANRRDGATRRAARVADIPTRSVIGYAAGNAALFIDLDFCTSRSAAEEEEIFDALVEILPKYADEKNIIHLQMMFKPLHKDGESVNRHDTLAQVVEHINDFPHVKEITICLEFDRFNWRQVSSASSIYNLKFIDWTFDLYVKNREVQHILANSRLDRRLRAAEKKLHG
ncbi:hypothetical protein OCU04_007093 [Sclerotinia nivalis]|uniref:Uncharacterized protein n=1 Tax=Sclerotinia nivalis TaxID=352851 RepID=A0A9X0APL7_9HELO|nr:hypothetical protein OCU04_007093 [Sclerotinia nivalis]